jgi:NADPH-dependent stearoyl-CoA 9-desaturase
MCGHFPEGVETFAKASIDGETRGGVVPPPDDRLSQHQGQQAHAHHDREPVPSDRAPPFPDLPSNRYAEIAPRVQEICSRYGLSYTSGSLLRQVGSAWKRVIKLSLPNDFSIHNTAKWVLRRRPPSDGGAAARK